MNSSGRLSILWEGKPARSYGGTADVRSYARQDVSRSP
jgi:hypothetical protein